MGRVQFNTRRLIYFLVILVGFIIYLVADKEAGLSKEQQILVGLGIAMAAAGIASYVWSGTATAARGTESAVPVTDPPVAQFLFSDVRSAPIWLAVRLWLGYQWIDAGWYKTREEAWTSGDAMQGFWTWITAPPAEGARPAITYGWYNDFIEYALKHEWHTWFGPLVAWGELLVGIGLIVGGLTGIAAFFGALMNFNFMLAGSSSTNPVLFFLALLVVMAWKVAGYLGADFYILPRLGAFWSPGTLFRQESSAQGETAPSSSPAD